MRPHLWYDATPGRMALLTIPEWISKSSFDFSQLPVRWTAGWRLEAGSQSAPRQIALRRSPTHLFPPRGFFVHQLHLTIDIFSFFPFLLFLSCFFFLFFLFLLFFNKFEPCPLASEYHSSRAASNLVRLKQSITCSFPPVEGSRINVGMVRHT